MKDLRGSQLLSDVNCFIEAKLKFHGLLHNQEVRWRQRSKVFWLKEGDKNTRFFHSAATSHHKKNSIMHLKNIVGMWVEDKV